jgi:hypothetical protein
MHLYTKGTNDQKKIDIQYFPGINDKITESDGNKRPRRKVVTITAPRHLVTKGKFHQYLA